MKVVINKCYGGFGVSKKVYEELGLKYDGYGYINNDTFGIISENEYAYRTDERLIKIIEKIGCEKASNYLASLEIITIPDNIEFEIDDYDGMESIHEKHRSWG